MFESKEPAPMIKDGPENVEINSEFWPGPIKSNSTKPPRIPITQMRRITIPIADTRTPKQKAKAKRKAKLAKMARKRNRRK